MNVVCIIFGVMFMIFGLLFFFGKLHNHIKAYREMPIEEKEKINIIPLCRNIGTVITLSGIIFLIGGLIETFREQWFVISMIIWLILSIIDVIYIYKSKRYQKK